MARGGRSRPMHEQSRALLSAHLSLSSRHAEKQAQGKPGSRSTGKIHSLRTLQSYTTCLKQAGQWVRQRYGIKRLKEMTPEQAQAYLEHRASQGLGQKAINNDRTALEFVTGTGSLKPVKTLVESKLPGRAYTQTQVEMVAQHQEAANALATRIAYQAGLRAHELLTLQRTTETQSSSHRQWDSRRFLGRDGVRYIVTGKGGLKREVVLPERTAEALEARRLNEPRQVTDRGIRYQQQYDIGGGNSWSRSFNRAANRALGWSAGAHGVRHAYAQERMEELARQGLGYEAARDVLSQELGHWRGDIVETYLR